MCLVCVWERVTSCFLEAQMLLTLYPTGSKIKKNGDSNEKCNAFLGTRQMHLLAQPSGLQNRSGTHLILVSLPTIYPTQWNYAQVQTQNSSVQPSTQAQLPTVAVHLQFNSSPFKTERLFGSLIRSYMLFTAPVCKLLFEMAILMLIFRHWRRSVQLRIQMF